MPSRRLIVIWPRYIASRGKPILDLSWITDSIAISGSIPTSEYTKLMLAGIKAVVDLREEGVDDASSLASLGIEFHHIPVKNYHAPSQQELQEACRSFRELQKAQPINLKALQALLPPLPYISPTKSLS